PERGAARVRRMRLAHHPAGLPAGARGRSAFGGEAGRGGAPAVTPLPEPESFLSGEHGEVGGRRGALRRAADRALDAWLQLSGTLTAIDEAAEQTPPREVLVASVYR